MPPRAKTPAPIDRPLSRAYLRDFGGWATAAPPGLLDPNTLRVMENCFVTPEGGVAVRPGLRYVFPQGEFENEVELGERMVGTVEPFFMWDGSKGLLFAHRHRINGAWRVGFKVARYSVEDERYTVHPVDDPTWGFEVPQGVSELAFTSSTTYVSYVQVDNRILALSDAGETMRMFWVGADKRAKKLQSIERPYYSESDKLTLVDPHIFLNDEGFPFQQNNTHLTLINGVDASKNVYSLAYFYTFLNEVGESAPSMVSMIKVQKPLSSWEDLGLGVNSPTQIAAIIPSGAWDEAVAQGAIAWNLYMCTWSNQDPVPTEARLLKTTEIPAGATRAEAGWARHLPYVQGLDTAVPLPNEASRVNYSNPSRAAQGIVAGDRVILVNDKVAGGVIRWSSNQQGEYLNFSSNKGGGYKTLTSGNLYVPATVKLWQNPQSTDTLTVLCMGVDGYSTSYYMQPASVAGLTQSTQIMGFEETTATPGTVSPYGCEVLNNALYHPLEWQLMKSTASNYNINHKSMTDLIRNKWQALRNKRRIISSQLDTCLYFIVDNPDCAAVPAGCSGNEVWVCDTANDGIWSRWLVPAVALRKLEIGGRLYMGVVRPEGLFVFDDTRVEDDTSVGGVHITRQIHWRFETNTQGANRAHDAWARLQQVSITLSNLQGEVRYGIRSYDLNGQAVEISKTFRDRRRVELAERPMPWDFEDHLLIRRDLKEWRLFVETVPNKFGHGGVSLVQYRYTPSSVNTGYEYGSVETFEYRRAVSSTAAMWPDRTTDSGIPQPMSDLSYP